MCYFFNGFLHRTGCWGAAFGAEIGIANVFPTVRTIHVLPFFLLDFEDILHNQ